MPFPMVFLFTEVNSSLPPPPTLLPPRLKDPSLWVQALSYFASQEECKRYIKEVLDKIEEGGLLQPLMVVQTLADSQYATLSDIKVGNLYTHSVYYECVPCVIALPCSAISR